MVSDTSILALQMYPESIISFPDLDKYNRILSSIIPTGFSGYGCRIKFLNHMGPHGLPTEAEAGNKYHIFIRNSLRGRTLEMAGIKEFITFKEISEKTTSEKDPKKRFYLEIALGCHSDWELRLPIDPACVDAAEQYMETVREYEFLIFDEKKAAEKINKRLDEIYSEYVKKHGDKI